MIPKTLPPGTTIEQWKQYELDVINHETRIRNKRELLRDILLMVQIKGVDATRTQFREEFDRQQSMDRPNEPGYYRANND